MPCNWTEILLNEKAKYRRNIRQLRTGREIDEKIKDFLLPGWTVSWDTAVWPQLDIKNNTFGKESSLIEFRETCRIIENVLEIKLLRAYGSSCSKQEISYIAGYGSYKGLTINVYLFPQSARLAGCEIEWEEKLVKQAIIPDACLGITTTTLPRMPV